MWQRIGFYKPTVMALLWASTALWGQNMKNAALPADTVAPLPRSVLQVSSVTADAVYYSTSLPNNASFEVGPANLSSDLGFGGSVTVDWTKFSERTSFSLSYTPSYTARWRYSSVDALNHLFTLNLTRKLAPRWTFNVFAGGNLSTYEATLAAPNPLNGVVATPATFADFANGLLAGKFANNPLLGVALTNPAVTISPVSTLLYGQRIFTASGGASLSYSYSPRLTISVTGNGNRTQTISSDQPLNNGVANLLPMTLGASGGFSFSYSLSPVSQIGGSVTTTWISSPIIGSYTTTSLLTLGRTFKRRWVTQVHGGTGVSSVLHSKFPSLPTQPRPVFGGSLGYKNYSSTLLGSYDRSTVDGYGLGASTTSTSNLAWVWRRPARSWWLDAGLGWQQLSGGGVGNISGWHTTLGLNRALSDHAVLRTQYAYLNYSGSNLGIIGEAAYSSSQSAIEISLSWVPRLAIAVTEPAR